MTKNFEAYYELDKTGLENKYVILVDGEVVAKGEDIETMLEEVLQKYPDEIPFVAKVPESKMLIFWVPGKIGHESSFTEVLMSDS